MGFLDPIINKLKNAQRFAAPNVFYLSAASVDRSFIRLIDWLVLRWIDPLIDWSVDWFYRDVLNRLWFDFSLQVHIYDVRYSSVHSVLPVFKISALERFSQVFLRLLLLLILSNSIVYRNLVHNNSNNRNYAVWFRSMFFSRQILALFYCAGINSLSFLAFLRPSRSTAKIITLYNMSNWQQYVSRVDEILSLAQYQCILHRTTWNTSSTLNEDCRQLCVQTDYGTMTDSLAHFETDLLVASRDHFFPHLFVNQYIDVDQFPEV